MRSPLRATTLPDHHTKPAPRHRSTRPEAQKDTYVKRGGTSFQPKAFLSPCPSPTFPPVPDAFSVHSSKFRIPQVLYLSLLRKHRGVYQQFPIWNSPGSRVLRASRFSSLFCSSSPRNLCARRLPRPGRGVSALSFSSPLRTFNLQLSAFNLRLPGPASSPDTE